MVQWKRKFPWLPNHGSIEAKELGATMRERSGFRGYRTTAPLKRLLEQSLRRGRWVFPWLPNHGSIEAPGAAPNPEPVRWFPWLPNHGSIEAGEHPRSQPLR